MRFGRGIIAIVLLVLFVISIVFPITNGIEPTETQSDAQEVQTPSKAFVKKIYHQYVESDFTELSSNQQTCNLQPEYQIDQNQTDHKDLCYGITRYGELAQSFQPTLNILTRVQLFGWRRANTSGNLKISIRHSLMEDDIASALVTPSEIPEGKYNADWFEIDIQDVYLIPESTYFIVWAPDFYNINYPYYWWYDYYRHPSLPEDDAYPQGMEYRLGEEYPLNDFCFITYGYAIPTVQILHPGKNATVYGTMLVEGSANDLDGTVEKVEINIDNSGWIAVNGTDQWSHLWNTTLVDNGVHSISVRSFDSQSYSKIDVVNVTVENTELKLKWIAGGSCSVSAEIDNHGQVNAYNVSWSIKVEGIIFGKIYGDSLGTFPLINPGEEKEIISNEITKGFSIVSVLVSADAENAQKISWTTWGVLCGSKIFVF